MPMAAQDIERVLGRAGGQHFGVEEVQQVDEIGGGTVDRAAMGAVAQLQPAEERGVLGEVSDQ